LDEGLWVGLVEGEAEGMFVGIDEGKAEGVLVGVAVGCVVDGLLVGEVLGASMQTNESRSQ